MERLTSEQRLQIIQTEENIAAVATSVDEDREMSIRRRSKQLRLFASTTWKILRKGLDLTAYKIQLVQKN